MRVPLQPLTAAVFHQPTCAFDPLFEKSVNRYEYSYKFDAPRNPTFGPGGNPLFRFFQSMVPSYYEPPVDDWLKFMFFSVIYTVLLVFIILYITVKFIQFYAFLISFVG